MKYYFSSVKLIFRHNAVMPEKGNGNEFEERNPEMYQSFFNNRISPAVVTRVRGGPPLFILESMA